MDLRVYTLTRISRDESRIVMPMSMEESNHPRRQYEIGLSYTIMKMEQQNTNSKEGVEVLQQAPFHEDAKLGKGHFTSKVYHLQSKIPSWMKGFAPASALAVHEDSWCAFPKSRTVTNLALSPSFAIFICHQCPLFSKCSLTIDTVTRPDNGCSENAHGLSGEQLAAREVEIIDIASVSRDYWSKAIGAPSVDLTAFKSQRTERGPLLKGWMDSCHPVMTTYKLVTMDAPIWGLGERLEDCIIAGERALFLACHRLCFAWIDEWYGMTVEQIREMERQTDMLLKKTLKKAGSKHEGNRKTLKDELVAVGS
ncbi:Phosphatidylinositol transfer protein alpha isoform [Zea mays]|uniref:Phosphatidylinositol transfer protein alpha isoform n=1 Tax=Zea mays TaxID=4577 RepID=A0A317Y5H3_MAIZE|nr:Phosphatidylinositol transfer protein alpha isoform [Zea mays]